MWIITPLGFFSIVQKPNDAAAGTLTVRARVRSDLEALQAAVLPGMGKITESKSTDYRFRATALRPLVEAAMAKLAAQLDYSNFKNQVAKVQGHPPQARPQSRAHPPRARLRRVRSSPQN